MGGQQKYTKENQENDHRNDLLYSMSKNHTSPPLTEEVYDYNPIVRSLFLLSQYHVKKASMLNHIVQTKKKNKEDNEKKMVPEKKRLSSPKMREDEHEEEYRNLLMRREIEEGR